MTSEPISTSIALKRGNMKNYLSGLAGIALGATGMNLGATLAPAKEAQPIVWDTSVTTGEEISKVYADIANSMGVTANHFVKVPWQYLIFI